MFKKILHKIESERFSNNFLWRFIVAIKDFIWKIYSNLYLKNTISGQKKLAREKYGADFMDALSSCGGVLHIGAHLAQEAKLYNNFGKEVVWIEADPNVFKSLKKNIKKYPKQQAINALVTDVDGKEYNFKISNNNGLSSSIFQFGKNCADAFDMDLHMVGEVKLKSKKLESIYRDNNLAKKNLDFMVIDVQGAELLALKGSKKLLKNFSYVYIEISSVEIYENGVLWPEIKEFMNREGFIEKTAGIPISDNVLFVKNLSEQAGPLTYSQFGQDLWVLEMTNNKKNGYFIEVGASDGIHLSNTYLLEKNFSWSGICVEPNLEFYKKLIKYRHCIADNSAVYSITGKKLSFSQADFLGGITEYFNEEERKNYRLSRPSILVDTISLTDLLDKFNAPKEIDYISIDTEGSEYEIIKNFNFSKYKVNLWTIEHNQDYRKDDYYEKISSFMKSHGYKEKIVKCEVWFWL